jgi:aminoglycoside phosphotransferase (APT) family kinase protein
VTAETTGTVVGLDAEVVGDWICASDPALRAPLRFARVGRGQSNLTFLVTDADGRRRVLRRPPLGRLLASAHDVGREHRILRALGPTDVPTPQIVAFTDDPAVTDVPLLLMEHVDGLVVDELATAERLDPGLRGRLGHALAGTLAHVHAVDLDATGLADLASHKPYAARQLKRWRRQWEASRTRDLPAVDALADRLEAAVPPQRELTLVHGDFHLLNVISDPETGAIRAVLDWELCTLGDPLADLGGLLAYWPQADDGQPGIFPAPALPGFPSRAELAETYAAATGRDLSALGFWHALGLWKVAIICEGVVRRTLDDQRNTAQGGAPDPRKVEDLITRAQLVAFEAGL